MTKRIVDVIEGCNDAIDIALDMNTTSKQYSNNVLYVLLPDGSKVTGYYVQEETLSDGSLVYNLLLQSR